jgi:hypothetical protein
MGVSGSAGRSEAELLESLRSYLTECHPEWLGSLLDPSQPGAAEQARVVAAQAFAARAFATHQGESSNLEQLFADVATLVSPIGFVHTPESSEPEEQPWPST